MENIEYQKQAFLISSSVSGVSRKVQNDFFLNPCLWHLITCWLDVTLFFCPLIKGPSRGGSGIIEGVDCSKLEVHTRIMTFYSVLK
jgi:hypothetical protein